MRSHLELADLVAESAAPVSFRIADDWPPMNNH